MKLASHLKMSVQRCKRETTSTEFVDWRVYLQQEINGFHREDYFFAQIACEIRRVLAKHKKRIKPEHFLIKFDTKGEEATPQSKKHASMKSKAFWFSLAQGSKKGKRRKDMDPDKRTMRD